MYFTSHALDDAGQTAERTWSSYLPGTEAGDSAAQYWSNRLVAAGGGFTDDPVASTGLFFSVLWTDETAASTAFTLGTAGTSSVVSRMAGLLKQWVRLGPSYSHSMGQSVRLSLRWGASPAQGGRYLQQIPSNLMRQFNQWLRSLRIPGSSWRTQDPGHLHIKP